MHVERTSREDRELLDEAAARFAATVRPGVADGALARAADLGLLSLFAPSDVGGLDADAFALAAVLRPIARVDAGLAAALLVQAEAQHVLRASGPWPGAVAAGELLAWPAFAGAAATPALSLDDHARLRGRAPLVPLAREARRLVLPAHANGDAVLCVTCALDDAGVSLAPADVLGLERCAPADVELACAAGVARGPIDAEAAAELRACAAIGVTAAALGLLDGAFATAHAYARERRQGGRFIVEWPEVTRMLAGVRDSIVVLEAALAGVSAARADGAATWREAAGALGRRAVAAACAGSTDGVQLLGGNGYVKAYPQERRMRDARQLRCLLG